MSAEETAWEEAAHAVARYHYKHTILRVKATDDHGYCDSERDNNNERELESNIARCAGFAALDRLGYKPRDSHGYYTWRESKDFRKAFQSALALSEGDSVAAELLVQWCMRRANVLVDKLWPQIKALTYRLLCDGGLNGQQVQRIIEESRRAMAV